MELSLDLDLFDLSSTPTRMEVLIRADTVELHHRDRFVGSTSRGLLRDFLRAPLGELAYDKTHWIEHHDVVWLFIDGQIAQPLTDSQLADLRSRL